MHRLVVDVRRDGLQIPVWHPVSLLLIGNEVLRLVRDVLASGEDLPLGGIHTFVLVMTPWPWTPVTVSKTRAPER